MENLLHNFKKSNFKYLNIAEDDEMSVLYTKDDGISIIPPENCSFYRDPDKKIMRANAPFMFTTVEGDFILRAHVGHDFLYTGDAACLMIRVDDDNWAKLCFEKAETDSHSLISSVTINGFSDRALGESYSWNNVWLYFVRKGNTFAMYYSPDGVTKRIVRFFYLDAEPKIQIGMMAQSPHGKGDAIMNFYTFEVKNYSVDSIEE